MKNKFWIFDSNILSIALLNEDSVPGLALKKKGAFFRLFKKL